MHYLRFFFIIFFFPLLLLAQEKAVGVIEGKVVKAITQEPIAGVRIQVVGTKLGAISSLAGKFIIKNVPVGVVNLRASSIGFSAFIQSDVVVGVGKPIQVMIQLAEQADTLGAVNVEASYYRKSTETITSTQLLNAEDVRRAPGVQEDVIRAVALLPGVGVTQAGRNDLVVRGGAPFENLFIVDNIEVPNINHFGSQGSTGGPLSLINIDFVRETQFSTGGFGAKYGDRLSSVTNISLRDGNEQHLAGAVTLSATGFIGIAEGPVSDNGSFLFSVRRSYLDFIFKAAGLGFIPQYWDFQGKVTQKIDNNNSLSFLFIGALDNVTFNNNTADNRFKNSQVASPVQNQYFTGLTWKSLFHNGFVDVTLGRSFTDFKTTQADSNTITIFRNYSTESENSLRVDGVWQIHQNTEFSFGNIAKYVGQLKYDIIMPGYLRTNANGTPQPLTVDTNFTAFRNATYLQLSHVFFENFRITLGARGDYYSFLNDKFYLSPRIGLSYSLSDISSVNISGGEYYQAPSYIWLIGDPNNGSALKPMQAEQFVLGYERILQADVKLQVEGYYKKYINYPARVFRPQSVLAPSGFDDVTNDIPYGLEQIANSATGFSRGLEIFMQKKLGEIPCYGLVSLSINETKFTSIDGIERVGPFDARVIFNISGGYRFVSNLEVSAKFRYSTGLPSTPFSANGHIDFSQYNAGEHLPDVHSMDVRVDKHWTWGNTQVITYIDIQNIYARKNVSGLRWNAQKQIAEKQESIGILPSVGISVEF